MKITVYSNKCDEKFCNNARPRSEYEDQVCRAIDIASQHNSNLLVLPGYTLGKDKTNFTKDKTFFQSLTDEYNISIVAEVIRGKTKQTCPIGDYKTSARTVQFVPHKPDALVEMCQIFAQGKDDDECKRVFLDQFNSGQRDLTGVVKRARVMLCGEHNVLKVPHNGSPYLPEGSYWSNDYDVLIIHSHDSTKRWRELKPRFTQWSQNGRYVIYNTNNLWNVWGSAIHIYHDGQKIIDGTFKGVDPSTTHIEDRWRLVTIEV